MGELEELSEFLDIPLTNEQKNEIAEKTSIDNMRKEYAAKKLPEGLINKGILIYSTYETIELHFLTRGFGFNSQTQNCQNYTRFSYNKLAI